MPPEEIAPTPTSITLTNTLSRKAEPFSTLKPGVVKMYNCGPTVYGYAHIGNLKKYVNDDTLRRTLIQAGLKVDQVINITDIGHLTSDEDTGEDKMVIAIRREGLPMTLESLKVVADKFTASFVEDLKALNISLPEHMPRASEWIEKQIELVDTLMRKGFAYHTDTAVYFDISKFLNYGQLGSINLAGLKEGARVAADPQKRNPHDFALWKKSPGLGFESPFGKGFPGWHIECSAMALGILGETIDIHTGGIDHIAIHHNNEIAQSEAATGKPFVRYWLHYEFITIDETKVSKSLGNTITLRELSGQGFHPLSYRYWILGGHYRRPMNFSAEGVFGAQNALSKLHAIAKGLGMPHGEDTASQKYFDRFKERMEDDLDTPNALAVMWEMLGDASVDNLTRRATLLTMDGYLGIGIKEALLGHSSVGDAEIPHHELPDEVRLLLKKREDARAAKDFHAADTFRQQILEKGYAISDEKEGTQKVHKSLTI